MYYTFSILLKQLILRHFLLSKCVTYKYKDKDNSLVTNRNCFAKLIIIMQKRSIDLKEVLKYFKSFYLDSAR